MKKCKTVCGECPWTRTVTPGALGGSEAEVYIGQVFGPFILPCHMACDFKDSMWRAKAAETHQCAGAAIFRTHVGAVHRSLHSLPADHEKVFSNAEEFVAHHKQIPIAEAKLQLLKVPKEVLVSREMHSAGITLHYVPARGGS